jgi:hypothetical protein
MMSPHISSAFAAERQTRYRREAAEHRAARRAGVVPARRSVAEPAPAADPVRAPAVGACRPSPAH